MIEAPALIFVLPGGGYEFHADYEAEPVSEWLESLGYLSRSLRYPIAPARHPAALDFVRAAIRDARETFGGPIGVLGFSAGGHLAGLAALAPAESPAERADFAILAYPVVLMGVGAHEGSRLSLLGPDPDPGRVASVSLDRLVTTDAPPFFIWHTADDEIVSASQSLWLAGALAEHDIAYELHIFPHGAHSLAMAVDSGAPSAWPALCARWISDVVGAGQRGL